MLCSPPPATTLASSCAGSEGFCAPCCRRSSLRSRIHNRPKTGRTLLLHERLSMFKRTRWRAASREGHGPLTGSNDDLTDMTSASEISDSVACGIEPVVDNINDGLDLVGSNKIDQISDLDSAAEENA